MSTQDQARQAFEDAYSKAYLDQLARRSTATADLVELLWAGFANGYSLGKREVRRVPAKKRATRARG